MSIQPGWYAADGDPPGTQRYWDGNQWIGEPQASAATPLAYEQSGGHALADPWERIGAAILDWMILFIPGAVVIAAVLGFFAAAENSIDDDSGFGFASELTSFGGSLVLGLLSFLWWALWVHFKGGTPGKLIVGLRVAKADGTTASGAPAFLRAANRLVGIVPFVGLLMWVVDLASVVMLFADDRHRTVMDLVAGTVVVKR